MVLAGAPVSTPHHAEYITNFGFSIIDAMTKINDPSTGEHLKIRVGKWIFALLIIYKWWVWFRYSQWDSGSRSSGVCCSTL